MHIAIITWSKRFATLRLNIVNVLGVIARDKAENPLFRKTLGRIFI
jgi:hypothetical protein